MVGHFPRLQSLAMHGMVLYLHCMIAIGPTIKHCHIFLMTSSAGHRHKDFHQSARLSYHRLIARALIADWR